MVYNNQYEVLIEMIKEKMSNWEIKSHNGGQKIELMKEVKTKDNQPILVFFLNDEYAVVLEQSQEERKYISLKEWDNSTILDTIFTKKQPFWTYIIKNEEDKFEPTLEAKEIFSQEVMDELIGEIELVKSTKKEWEITRKNFNKFLEKTSVVKMKTELGDVLVVNDKEKYLIIQIGFDSEEYKYGLLDIRTNKVIMKCKELVFEIGTELFEEGGFDIITSILKKEMLKNLREN